MAAAAAVSLLLAHCSPSEDSSGGVADAVGAAGASGAAQAGTSGRAAPAGSGDRAGSGAAPAGGSGGQGVVAGGGGAAGTSAAGGGDAPAPADAGASDASASDDAGPASSPFPAVTDLQAEGPFTSTMLTNTGPGNGYTVFLPDELAPSGAKNPIVGWMSGGSTDPSLYTLLPHLASHGFVVVASNTVPEIGAEVQLGQEIIAGIDWALAQNADPSSTLFEKLDANAIAAMGYSMGALATTTIAADARLTTTVHISGGNMVTERIANLHAPAAFICGENDIADPNCATDFAAATTPVFYGVFRGGDHLGVLLPPYADRIRGAVTGWLRWQLMSDTTLAPMFVGSDCGLCTDDANWVVQQKNLE